MEKYLRMELSDLKKLARDLEIPIEGMGKTKIAELVAEKVEVGPEESALAFEQEEPAVISESASVKIAPINSALESRLADYIHAGLRVKIDDKCFHFAVGSGNTLKQDSGTIHQPEETIVKCAERLLYG